MRCVSTLIVAMCLLTSCGFFGGSATDGEFHPGIVATGKLELPDFPTGYNFGDVWVGDDANKTLTLKNSGFEAATNIAASFLVGLVESYETPFPGRSGTCGTELGTGAECTFSINYSPLTSGVLNDTLELTYDYFRGTRQHRVSLTANALAGTTGSLDTQTFLGTGILTATYSVPSIILTAIDVDSQRRTVGAGSNTADMVVVRHLKSGALDTSFNTNGIKVMDYAGENDAAYGGLIQSDGKLVTCGKVTVGGQIYAAFARLNSDGSLDSSFGTAGIANTAVNREVFRFARQTDGAYVGAGPDATRLDFKVYRVTAGGVLDTSFNTAGTATIDLGGDESMSDLILRDDGTVLISGGSNLAPVRMALERLTSSGNLDTSFSTDGLSIRTSIGAAAAIGIAAGGGITPDSLGRTVYFGQTTAGLPSAVRICSDGAIDSSFGTNGFARPTHALVTTGLAIDGLVDTTGKVVAIGAYEGSTQNDSVLLRLTSAGVIDSSFDADGFAFPSSVGDVNSTRTSIKQQADSKYISLASIGTGSKIVRVWP